MSVKHCSSRLHHWVAAAGLTAAAISGIETARADTLLDPPVFASQNGVLDIMMVAMPQPIPGISYSPRTAVPPSIRPGGCFRSARVRLPD